MATFFDRKITARVRLGLVFNPSGSGAVVDDVPVPSRGPQGGGPVTEREYFHVTTI